MRSPRTEPPRSGPTGRVDLAHGLAAFVQRLNTRLIAAFSIVALVGLIVSAFAINQILPGYFARQTEERLGTVAGATALLMQQLAANEIANDRQAVLAVAELRDARIIRPAVRFAVQVILPATYTVLDDRGQRVVQAQPDNPSALFADGLQRDAVAPVTRTVELELANGEPVQYTLSVSNPYTSRAATLEQLQSAILGAGLLALLVSVAAGAYAARRLTVPISRLRRVAGRVAQGELDERATTSGVLEVDELAAQFNVMADRFGGTLRMLEADRDRLREFVADVSHELRTPIAALKMYTELQRDGDVDEGTRREFLERSTQQIGRLDWLSTNLLDLSRIDAGIFPLDMREGDLRDPVQAVVQALSEVALERGVSLDSAVPADAVELRFDRERIVQLLTNLIGNSLKFTPRGGAVSVRLVAGPDASTIEVRDTGPGIPADELPHIFDRFYRGTNTGEARASGSGLGLAIVRSIVDMHGGQVEVASVVGEGTVFRILLPMAGGAPDDSSVAKVNETSRVAQPARNAEPIG
jgi:signal transduction histidine kinase